MNVYVRPARTATAIELPDVSPTTSLSRNTRYVPTRDPPPLLHESVPVWAPTARSKLSASASSPAHCGREAPAPAGMTKPATTAPAPSSRRFFSRTSE